MMGRAGSSSTIRAMHVGSAAMAFAVGRAMQDGIQRAAELRAVDQAHAAGQRYYAKRLAQRKAVVKAEATAAKNELMALRAMLHGE